MDDTPVRDEPGYESYDEHDGGVVGVARGTSTGKHCPFGQGCCSTRSEASGMHVGNQKMYLAPLPLKAGE